MSEPTEHATALEWQLRLQDLSQRLANLERLVLNLAAEVRDHGLARPVGPDAACPAGDALE